MIPLCRGKKPARPGAIKLRFGSYLGARLAPVPMVIGDPSKVLDWKMLANDAAADCVQAGAAHETMKLVVDSGRPVPLFTPTSVLSDYRAINPNDLQYKDGTDVATYAKYRQDVGVLDASGLRHKIDMYAGLSGDIDELARCIYWFGGAGIGVALPDNAEEQFHWRQAWDVTNPPAPPGEGHYISALYRGADGNFLCATWGRLHPVTPRWIQTYVDEGLAFLSRERAAAVLEPDMWAQLKADFEQVTA